MTVLDASVLIAHVERRDAHQTRATEILAVAAERGGLEASVVTFAEVLVGPTRGGVAGMVSDALRELGVSETPLGRDAARRLAALRVETGLKLPDCCVLLAAEDVRATHLATFDERLAAAARRRGHTVP